MKNILLIIATIISFSAFSQDTTKTRVIEQKGTKIILYSKVKSTVQANVKQPKEDIITVDDSKLGKLICFNGFDCLADPGKTSEVLIPVRYKMTIEVKDNKYKITLSNFTYPKGSAGINWKVFSLKTDGLIADFIDSMNENKKDF